MTKLRIPDPTTVLERMMRAPLESPTPRQGRIGMIVLVGIVGFLAGAAGGLAAISFILPFPIVFDGAVLRRSRAQPRVTANLPALAPIAASVVDLFAVDGKADPPTLLPLASRTGRGVALTSDGWVVTVRSALPTRVAARPVVITSDRKIRGVDRIAFDPISDLAFVHVPTIAASVLPLRPRDGLPIGTALFVPTADGGLVPVTLRTLTARADTDAVRSSDRLVAAIALDANIDVPIGTPVVDAEGAMVGITMGGDLVLPVDAITSALPSLFANGAVTRNVLGVSFRETSEFGYDPQRVADGIVLSRDGRTPAVSSSSPLRNRLAEGDALLAIGDDPLTARRTLPELLQEYPLGASVPIRARHGDRDIVLSIMLATRSGETMIVAVPSAP
ncbi:MAG: S1C family serine protease [bacterium]|nr:S1C family serine protease [bacterium]